jgi:DNA invertase Pin-like site-specific DNA recombinase
MLDAFAACDVVTVTHIDRLARSTFDLFAIVKPIVDAKAQFRSRVEPWAGTSIGRLLIAVLGGLADVERDFIRTRTAPRGAAELSGKLAGRCDRAPRRKPKDGRGARRAQCSPNSRAAPT